MKRLFVILSLFYSLSANSQTYFPFPIADAIWTVDFITPGQWPGQEYRAPFGYTTYGDSLINGLLYTKIYTSDSAGNIDPWGLVALTREQNKVVYCKYVGTGGNQLPNEVILYDYNLTAGDTFSFPSYGNQTELLVDSVGVIQTFTGNRNAIYLSITSNPSAAYYFNPVWVEGIGDIVNGVIYHEVPWVDWWCEGRCFSYQSTLVWSRYNNACWIHTGINEFENNDVDVKCYPNPSSGDMEIKFNNVWGRKKIEVFDPKGKIVLVTTITDNRFVINKRMIGNGFYLLRVVADSGGVYCNKILFMN